MNGETPLSSMLNAAHKNTEMTPMSTSTILRLPPKTRSLTVPQPTRPRTAPPWVMDSHWLA